MEKKEYKFIHTIPDNILDFITEDDKRSEELMDILQQFIDSDQEAYDKKCRSLFYAYKQRNPDLMLLALCGYTLETLIDKCNFDFSAIFKTKKDYIGQIHKIIKKYGSFSIHDVKAKEIPMGKNKINGNLLYAEYFSPDTITVCEYEDGAHVQNDSGSTYQDLSLETLQSIYQAARLWKKDNQ